LTISPRNQGKALTAADISNAVRVFFTYKHIKLFKNEPHKKKIGGEWVTIKDLGYPSGSHDLMGWRTTDGKTVGCEIKTLNDTEKKDQKKFSKMIIGDNCLSYLAKELPGRKIEIKNRATGDKVVIAADIEKG
jgi:hypothetical protein